MRCHWSFFYLIRTVAPSIARRRLARGSPTNGRRYGGPPAIPHRRPIPTVGEGLAPPADSHRRPHSAGHCPTSSPSDARRYGWSSRPRRGASRSAREHAPTLRNCHCEPVTESLVWQSASPVFKLPPSRRLRGTRRATPKTLREGGKDTLRRLRLRGLTDGGRGLVR